MIHPWFMARHAHVHTMSIDMLTVMISLELGKMWISSLKGPKFYLTAGIT